MHTTLEARPRSMVPLPGDTSTTSEATSSRRRWSAGAVIPLDGLVNDAEVSWQRGGPGGERRQQHRYDFNQTICLLPLDEQTEKPIGEALYVEACDISASGIGFSHEIPLPFKKVSITLMLPGGNMITAITRLLWCRFTREGRYQSGGQFVRCNGVKAS